MAKKSTRRAERILILPDAHYPYQDPGAMGCVAHVAEVWQPDRVIVLGDWLDAAAFSTHAPLAPEERAVSFLRDEVAPCNAMLDHLQRYSRQLIYLEGNHEHRVERHSAVSVLGADMMSLASPEVLLRRRVGADGEPGEQRKRFTYVPYLGRDGHSHWRVTQDLIAVHGWTHAQNAAAVHAAKARSVSIVFGHVHRAQSVTTRDPLTNKLHHSWSPGCLCRLNPLYMASSPTDWAHGFSMVFAGRSSWSAYTVPIHPGGWCVLPDGQEVRG
jgi:predicted phosphodiesterase